MLNLYGLKKDLPSVYPEKTLMFVKEQLEKVDMKDISQRISKTEEWTVKNVVERFHNLCLDWESNASLLECRRRILEIIEEPR